MNEKAPSSKHPALNASHSDAGGQAPEKSQAPKPDRPFIDYAGHKELTPKRKARIAKRLDRVLGINDRIGKLCELKEALLARAMRDGLTLNAPITLADGKLWNLRKPDGKFVRFAEVELKKIPTFKRQRDVASTEEAQ